jgi:hypothetical protein
MWLGRLEKNCKLGEREAQRYMRFAKHYAEMANPTSMSDLSSMTRGLLAIATAKSEKNEDASESDEQRQGNDADTDDDEECHDRGDEETEVEDEEPEEDDSYDDGTDDDDSDANSTDEEEDAYRTDDEEDDDDDDDDDQEEPDDHEAVIDRIMGLLDKIIVAAEPHLDDLEPVAAKARRRTLKKARNIIRALLGVTSDTQEH